MDLGNGFTAEVVSRDVFSSLWEANIKRVFPERGEWRSPSSEERAINENRKAGIHIDYSGGS